MPIQIQWPLCLSSTTLEQVNTMIEMVPCAFDSLLNDLSNEWQVDFDDLNGINYDLDLDDKKIILHNYGLKPEQALSSPYFRPQIILTLAEALRMTRHVEWLDGMLDRYHPETIILIGRVCVADTTTQKIKIAWESKMDGDNSLWKHMLCSEATDMAIAYECALEKYLNVDMDEEQALRKSMAVAFNQWFTSSDRIRDCDHDTLNLIDGMIADNAKFHAKRLEKNAITCLTLMPGENSSYIDRFLQDDILKNPYYVAINDCINQAHFMQVVTDMNTVRIGGLVFSDSVLAARFAHTE